MTDDYDYDASDIRPRRPDTKENPMKNLSLLVSAVAFLGLCLLLCISGVIWLASANPARDIPDILVATPTGIVGLIGGILVNPRRNSRDL